MAAADRSRHDGAGHEGQWQPDRVEFRLEVEIDRVDGGRRVEPLEQQLGGATADAEVVHAIAVCMLHVERDSTPAVAPEVREHERHRAHDDHQREQQS